MQALEVLALGPVLPVVTLDDPACAVPLGLALLEGGIRAIEVTLRTPAALAAVTALRSGVPGLCVGVGTLLDAGALRAAVDAGAEFGVSPGLTPALADAIADSGLPCVPGVMTPGEVMAARDLGFTALKFFPAVPAGGAAVLAAWAPVFQDVVFCPTGGIGPLNAGEFLKLRNVRCVGGSWLTPPALMAARDWAGIARLAQAAAKLRAGA